MKNKKHLLFVLIALLSSVYATAQPGFDPDVDDVAPIPGLLLAAAAGIVVGVKYLKENKE
ncbi:MAG: hypothetical protein WBA16_11940 [Nonlabens sp.]